LLIISYGINGEKSVGNKGRSMLDNIDTFSISGIFNSFLAVEKFFLLGFFEVRTGEADADFEGDPELEKELGFLKLRAADGVLAGDVLADDNLADDNLAADVLAADGVFNITLVFISM
jgi:hypothetical protein